MDISHLRLYWHYLMAVDIRRKFNSGFWRRKNRLFKKGWEINSLFGVRVVIILEKEGKYYTFSSTDKEWPPGMDHIVCKSPLHENSLSALTCESRKRVFQFLRCIPRRLWWQLHASSCQATTIADVYLSSRSTKYKSCEYNILRYYKTLKYAACFRL